MADLLLTAARLHGRGDDALLIRDGRIAALGGDARRAAAGAPEVRADGLLVAPGLIDLQLNGAFGRDFSAEPAAVREVGPGLAAMGVTAFLPTIVSSPPATYAAALSVATAPTGPGAVPLGWHFEGPMLAATRHGAHAAAHLRMPADIDVDAWLPQRGVRMVTLAPELPGALAMASRLSTAGVVVAAGHTDADVRCAADAADAGVTHATHLFNAMRGLDARAPGIGLGLLLDDRVTVGVIADGHHLAAATMTLIARIAGVDRVSLVTDGVAALGQAAGEFRLAGQPVTLAGDGSVRTAAGTLAGAATALPELLRRWMAATGWNAEQAIQSVTAVPARILGLPDRGRLAVGARGDLVLLGTGLEVVATVIGGEVVHGGQALSWR